MNILKVVRGAAQGVLAIVCGIAMSHPLHAQSSDADTSNLPVLKAMPLYYDTGTSKLVDRVDRSDTSAYFWIDDVTHQFAYWTMGYRSRADLPGASYFGRTGWNIVSITPGYTVGAIGDVSGDGLADLVWTSSAHDLYLWTKAPSDPGYVSSYIGTYPQGWKLMGAGDVNGDGFADLIWHNDQTCEFGYWTMHGTQVSNRQTIGASCGYRIAALGDINRNGLLDIVWTSGKNDLYIWYGDGAHFRSVRAGNYPAGTQLLAVGNFDGVKRTMPVAGQAQSLDRFNLIVADGAGRLSLLEWYADAPWPNVTGGTISSLSVLGTLEAGDYLGPVVYSGGLRAGVVLLNDRYVNANTGMPVLIEKSSAGFDGYGLAELSNYPAGTLVPLGVSPPMVTYPLGWRMIGKAAN